MGSTIRFFTHLYRRLVFSLTILDMYLAVAAAKSVCWIESWTNVSQRSIERTLLLIDCVTGVASGIQIMIHGSSFPVYARVVQSFVGGVFIFITASMFFFMIGFHLRNWKMRILLFPSGIVVRLWCLIVCIGFGIAALMGNRLQVIDAYWAVQPIFFYVSALPAGGWPGSQRKRIIKAMQDGVQELTQKVPAPESL